MNCEETGLLIEELHDGELIFGLKKELEAHLAVCQSCQIYFESIWRLDQLLEKSPVPPPSALLDHKIKQALAKKSAALAPKSGWRQVFFGSIRIPTPALAVFVALIAFVIAAANMMGKGESISANIGNLLVIEKPSPDTTQPIRFVEVPVIKRIIVNRVIFIKNSSNAARSTTARLPGNYDTNSPIAENKYFTKIGLKGFQPLPAIKTEIIRETDKNEK